MGTYSPIQFFDTNPRNSSQAPVVCYAPTMVSVYGVWLGEDLFNYTMPLLLLQLLLVILLTRAVDALLQPLGQPRYISEIIGGVLLGPAVLGKSQVFTFFVFPLRSLLVFEGFAHLGIIYYIFTVGVEVEASIIARAGPRSVSFAAVSIAAPFTIGALSGLAIYPQLGKGVDECAFVTFMGAVLAVTGLSALARVLTDLKLIGSEIGRLAMSAAILADVCTWPLLALAVTLAQSGGTVKAAAWSVLVGLALLAGCLAVVRPAVLWVVRRTPEGEEVDELYTCMILVGVLVSAFLADAVGTHPIFGAFVYGVAVPSGPVGEALVEKVEDLVEGLLLPIFFVFTGIRTNLYSVTDAGAAALLALAVVVGAVAKVAGAVLVAFLHKMPIQDGLSIGMVMNTRGVMEMVVLNVGRDKWVLGNQSFTVLLFTSLLVTALVGPLVTALVKPARRLGSYKRRSIRWHNPDSELRMLACVHTPRNVPALITLLDTSNPTKRSPIFVYALHLIELTGRASSMLIASSSNPKDASHGGGSGRVQTQSEHIMGLFEAYEQQAGGVSVQALTAFSRYSTMHEDVCGVAEEKHVALILLPFHKHQTVDGEMEVTHQAVRALNRSVLGSARCSVGILIDRGLGTASRGHRASYRIVLLFLGGPDDREALAFAARMAGRPGTTLTVLRLVPHARPPPSPPQPGNPKRERVLMVATDDNMERRADEECISEFRALGGEGVVYMEKFSSNAEETVEAIRSIGSGHDLYVVGRGPGEASPMMAGLTEFTECPELGLIGDLLASSDFMATVSVLVVQRGGAAGGTAVEAAATLDSPGEQVRLYVYKDRTAQGR